MAIFHRILRKFYKLRNKKFPLYKTTPVIKAKKLRSTKPPLRRYLTIVQWNRLSQMQKLAEQTSAIKDVALFTKKCIEIGPKTPREEVFTPYLPPAIWAAMKPAQRKIHLQKRDVLLKRGIKLSKPKFKKVRQKVYFCQSRQRPLLRVLGVKARRYYLKALIDRARLYAQPVSQSMQIVNIDSKAPWTKKPIFVLHHARFHVLAKIRIPKNATLVKYTPKSKKQNVNRK